MGLACRASDTTMKHPTIWPSVRQAIINSVRIALVFCFEFILARFAVATREYVRDELVVLAELLQRLEANND